jgi:hypothetical protein
MSKFWKIAGIAALVAVIGAGLLGVVAYAQEPEPNTPLGQMSDYLEQVMDAIAEKLGVERVALDSAIDESQREVRCLGVGVDPCCIEWSSQPKKNQT